MKRCSERPGHSALKLPGTFKLLGILAIACLGVAGCQKNSGDQPKATANAVAPSPQTQTPMDKWARSCALCHVDGNGGAPRVGNTDEWASRVPQGEDVMIQHVIEGYNKMPPLGYCMDCTRADFQALTKYMAGIK